MAFFILSESILHSFREWSMPHDMIFSPSRSKSYTHAHTPLSQRGGAVTLSYVLVEKGLLCMCENSTPKFQ